MPPLPSPSDLVARLTPFVSAERAAAAVGYTPSARVALGVSVPHLRAVLKPIRVALKEAPPADALACIRAFAASEHLEVHHAAYDLLDGLPALRRSLDADAIEALAAGNDNWASVDTWACCVAGRAWQEGAIDDARVLRWAASADRWWRRAALVCTVPLNMRSRGGRGDTARTLRVCTLLVADRDPMVAKALSWALRELVHFDRAAVEAFLVAHAGVIPALVRREVRTRLVIGRKNG